MNRSYFRRALCAGLSGGVAVVSFCALCNRHARPRTGDNLVVSRNVYDGNPAIVLRRDGTVARSPSPPVLKLFGELPGKAILLTDTYPSAPLSLSLCQAGAEQFLRVIRLAGPRTGVTFHLKIASCRDNIELADPGIQWSEPARTLTIHWLQPPTGQQPTLTLRVGMNGHVVVGTGAVRP